jgi:rhomboid family GlyGly-CTERM serine protease
MNHRVPIVTLLICLAATTVFLLPGLEAALVYDRAAIIRGQFWRWVTGNLVHVSVAHLVYDVIVVALAGWIIERRHGGDWVTLCLVASVLIGGVVFVCHPQINRFGGLSGMAFAGMTYLAVQAASSSGIQRRFGWAGLCLMIAKMTWEFVTGATVFIDTGHQSVVLPATHAAGAITGGIIALGTGFLCRASGR